MFKRNKNGQFVKGNIPLNKGCGIFIRCLVCNRQIYIINARAKTAKFCSKHCLNKHKITLTGVKSISFKHGLTGKPFYKVWTHMKSRCSNPNDQAYDNYGGRGIKVCKRWYTFNYFKEDMYESYLKHIKKFGEKDTKIERQNNNGSYTPKNCCWATRLEQGKNKRNNRRITYNGKTMIIQEWSRCLNINPATLRHRLYVAKWPIEKALTSQTFQGRYKAKQ